MWGECDWDLGNTLWWCCRRRGRGLFRKSSRIPEKMRAEMMRGGGRKKEVMCREEGSVT